MGGSAAPLIHLWAALFEEVLSSIVARPNFPERRGGRLMQPAQGRMWFSAFDLILVVVLNGLLVIGMWIRHGGLNQLQSSSAKFTAAGQITALVGTYAALVQILLMSRSPWLERRFGMDGLAQWHRWLGFTLTILISAHVVLSTVGYALGGDGNSVPAEAWTLTTNPYVLMATAATGLVRGQPEPDRQWRIGIRHPLDSSAVAAVIEATDLAVATSGSYGRGDHILDARSGRPSRLLSLAVVGPTIMLADAYATAGFALGERGVRWISEAAYAVCGITADGLLRYDDLFGRLLSVCQGC
jgi:hypothetical protein